MIDIRMNFTQFDDLGRQFGAEGVQRLMQKYSIDKVVLVPSMAVDSDFRQGNKDLFQVVNSSDRLFGYLVVNMNYPQESIQLMRSGMVSPKFVALALFGGASRPYPNLEDCSEILNAYRRFTKPVFINTPHADAVVSAQRIAKEFPSIKFVLGSMGGEDWKATIAGSRQLNISLETSGSFDSEKIDTAIAAFGANRLIFGSGAPTCDVSSKLGLLRASGMSESNMTRVLHENAVKLFNI